MPDITAFLNPAEEAELTAAREQMRAEAWDYLAARFSNVRSEEISDQTARDIRTIKAWDAECTYCSDLAKCGHSCAVLIICEEGSADGWREFVTRARCCDLMKAEKERREMMNPAKRGGGRT